MHLNILDDFLIIISLALGTSFLCHRIKVPTLVGFLLAGALGGPHGFALIGNVTEVETMAEIGVILLLFSIGLEFSLGRLMEIKRVVLLGGGLQVGLTLAAALGISRGFDFSWPQSVFLGCLVSLSSTAVVLKLYQESSTLDTRHGRTVLGILIFQDILVVPMMIVTPMLGGAGGSIAVNLLTLLGKSLLLAGFVFVAARWLIPFLLLKIVGTRNRELFLLGVIFIAFALAWFTSLLGMSLALGAFLAGLMISESEYSHHTVSNILPFKDVFMSFFFVSVGMLFNGTVVVQHLGIILVLTAALIALKFLCAGAATFALGYPLRTILLVGFGLSQVGEFSFILSRVGEQHGLIQGDHYAIFLAVTCLTLLATPFLMNLGERIAGWTVKIPLPGFLKGRDLAGERQRGASLLKDHVIIVGFGLVGRNLARAAKGSRIPNTVIELNPKTVRRERAAGESILYGDAAFKEVLHSAHVESARVLVITFHDPGAVHRIVRRAREMNPGIHVITRARFFHEVESLYGHGADEVIPDEFETSIEIFTRVLTKYLVSRDKIEALSHELRAGGYERLRARNIETVLLKDLKIPDMEISTLTLDPGSALADRTLAEMNLRRKYGVTLLALVREGKVIPNPDPEASIHGNDEMVVLGSTGNITRLSAEVKIVTLANFSHE
ncbi:MAG: cation:proton antiporter, partial [Planctomycetes bacterium]|nr:cation:proton antiporter [Planctomycetota bacterium]